MNPLSSPPVLPMRAEGLALLGDLSSRPDRVVITRLHAFGDAVIATVAVEAVRRALPSATITVVTTEACRPLFESLAAVDHVVTMAGSGEGWLRQGSGALVAAGRVGRGDLLVDLQRSRATDLLVRYGRWGGVVRFDRFAPKPALDRYLDALEAAGVARPAHPVVPALRQHLSLHADELLGPSTCDGTPFVILNPAGCWSTKNWPIERYAELGRRLVRERGVRLLLLGTAQGRGAMEELRVGLGSGDVIDLVERTTIPELLAVVRRARLVVSDDSGLMHVAWTQGVPTVGIFGASRRLWSGPSWGASVSFGSEDLPCGACMRSECLRGDRHCLTRVGVADVLGAIERLRPFD